MTAGASGDRNNGFTDSLAHPHVCFSDSLHCRERRRAGARPIPRGGLHSGVRGSEDERSGRSRELVLAPARAVNPKVKVIIKFPNWYEHFQANGYDLDKEPKMFDGIYTGTETRDPVITDQHLQQYDSYMLVRYFDNIAQDSNRG